jgi:hypothetical protein
MTPMTEYLINPNLEPLQQSTDLYRQLQKDSISPRVNTVKGIIGPDLPQTNCINYGHGGDYDVSKGGRVDTDISKLQDSNITCVRIAYDGWNNPDLEAVALLAKSKGEYVVFGGDWGDLDPSQLNDYTAQVLKEANWAEDNKIDQFSLGNEQEGRLNGMTKYQWVTFVKSLATKVKEVYGGKISYEINGNDADFWATQTRGDIDLLGFNLYCGHGCNKEYLQENIDAHGVDHVYVSEINADMDTGDYENDTAHADELKADLIRLRTEFPNTPFYFFTYEACSTSGHDNNGVAAHWGVFQCNPQNVAEYNLAQPAVAAVLGIR